ncbi:MAG: aspartate carbamoyltransferase [Anaerolineae bacterium]|jgi:aspartate carbamoyltransferase
MDTPLAGANILTIQDLDKDRMLLILNRAANLEASLQKRWGAPLIPGRIMALLFYEPEPWVRSSFESAMLRLGGRVLSIAGLDLRVADGDSHALARAAQIASGQADVIVHRHPEVFSAHESANGARVPLINAGDGTHEHPTQALADLYTIRRERGVLDGLSIAIIGDLRRSRSAHSLARALAHWDVTLRLVSPASLKMAKVITVPLKRSVPLVETDDLSSGLEGCDVLCTTPIDDRHFARPSDAAQARERCTISRALAERLGSDVLVIPSREGEFGVEPEALARGAYRRQALDAVWVRMAILALVLGAPPP